MTGALSCAQGSCPLRTICRCATEPGGLVIQPPVDGRRCTFYAPMTSLLIFPTTKEGAKIVVAPDKGGLAS